LERIDLALASKNGHALWSLNPVQVPSAADEALVRKRLLTEFNIEIGAGLGPLKGKIWRIGLMGESSTKTNVDKVVEALRLTVRN